MPGIAIRTQGGPQSYEVAENVVGGQACEGRTGSKVGVAAAGSRKFLGVAINDAIPAASITTGLDGNGVLNAAQLPTHAVLAKSGDEVPVTYAANANFGDPLKIAANGQFTPLLATDTDTALCVARCTEPGGVTVATKATGLARIL